MTITNITERERELSARVATDAEIMAGLATMSQNYALKAKGLEDQLEIAQGTLKNLWARVAELEAELATANSGLECYAMQLAKDTVQSDIDRIMAQGVEIAELKAELAAVRNQQPIGYLEKHLIESGRKIQLCNLTKTSLWADSVPVYIAAGAHPAIRKSPASEVRFGTDAQRQALLEKSLQNAGALYLAAGAQPVPEGMALVPDAAKQDAARYQWLTADLSTADGRVERNELLSRMSVMSYSTASRDIDAAMLQAAKEPKCP